MENRQELQLKRTNKKKDENCLDTQKLMYEWFSIYLRYGRLSNVALYMEIW